MFRARESVHAVHTLVKGHARTQSAISS